MTEIRRLLLIPCLSPVLLMLLIATLNFSQPSSLRVLTWRLPTLPIGAWIAIATLFGSGVSAASGLAVVGTKPALRREVRRPVKEPSFQEPIPNDQPPRSQQSTAVAWPERDVRDPAPTVSVPFRIVHRGNQFHPETNQEQGTTQTQPTQTKPQPIAEEADDWNQQIGDDW